MPILSTYESLVNALLDKLPFGHWSIWVVLLLIIGFFVIKGLMEVFVKVASKLAGLFELDIKFKSKKILRSRSK